MKDNTETQRIIGRHMARLLTNLEEAGCPSVFRNEVRAEMQWLRSDLCTTEGTDNGNQDDSIGNR